MISSFEHQFVQFIPNDLRDGVLYVSLEFATATHKCACGCGNKVVTPITRTDWRLIFDGESVSLEPSIGNWNFPCRSHYWITGGRVLWAEDWSESQISAARARDARRKDRAFAREAPQNPGEGKVRQGRATKKSGRSE
jgi:hypothetical protein